MMAAEVDGRGNNFAARKEQALFKLPEGFGWYDVAPDGKRFVMTTQKVNPNMPLTLVQNWTALLGQQAMNLSSGRGLCPDRCPA